MPEKEALAERLPSVLGAIYAAYTNDWIDIDGAKALGYEAIWLARVVVTLLPEEPEPKGLLSLMLYSEARRSARQGSDGSFIPFDSQDVDLWDEALVRAATTMLHQSNLGGPSGRYQVEAALQSAHCARRITGVPNWHAIIALYNVLTRIAPSPVVTLNRAAAIASSGRPDVALADINGLADHPQMTDYLPYWTARGRICADLGRSAEAVEAFTVAIGLCWSERDRSHLESERTKILL